MPVWVPITNPPVYMRGRGGGGRGGSGGGWGHKRGHNKCFFLFYHSSKNNFKYLAGLPAEEKEKEVGIPNAFVKRAKYRCGC